MNLTITKRITVLLFALAFLFQQTNAQAPAITDKTSLPIGSANCTGVAYGNGVYITIMSAGKIYISTDGNSWSKVTDAGIVAGTFNRVAFGAGVFVIVGNNGLILSSANGLNWTSRTSNTSNHFNEIQFLQSAFYAIGMNATLRRSTDGITWNIITLGVGTTTDMFMSITYGNGAFAIGARNSGASAFLVYRSTTGNSSSWTYQSVSTSLSLNKLVYLKNKFFAFFSGTEVYTSADAITWTNSSSSMILTQPDNSTATLSTPNQIFNGLYDGTRIYLFGYSGGYYQNYGSVFYSTDGINWTLAPKTAYIVCQGSAWINNMYFEYGNEGIVSSTNGTSYKYPGGNYSGLAYSGTSYVGVGAVSTSGIIFRSTDFSGWTEKTPAGQKEMGAVVYTGSKYVAVGNQSVLQSTDDGNTWTQIAAPSNFLNTLAYGSSLFVSGGYNPSTYAGNISYSADGISWTTANTDNNFYYKVKYVNGKYFALGYAQSDYSGRILYSANGTSWTDITPSLPFVAYYYNDVIYDGSKYHFMGMEVSDLVNYNSLGFFSVSTATPTITNSFANKGTITGHPSTLGGYSGEGAFSYSNGHYIGSVVDINNEETYIIYSSDGISWTSIDAGESSGLYGIVTQGTTFNMLGSGDGKFIATFNSLLPVKLADFSASPLQGQALLQWKTTGEINSDYFSVQHSTDAVSWETIGTLKAARQSQAVHNYQFTHVNPAKGNNYYRLLNIDRDGEKNVSDIKLVYFANVASFQLYPNPARGLVQVELPGTGYATATLFNAGGQQVYQQSGSGRTMQLSIGNLSKGIYQVVVSQGAFRYTQQLSHQ